MGWVEEKGKGEFSVSGHDSLKGYRNVKIFPFFALWGNFETEGQQLKKHQTSSGKCHVRSKPGHLGEITFRLQSHRCFQVILSLNVWVGLLPWRENNRAQSLTCLKYKLSKSRRRPFPPCPHSLRLLVMSAHQQFRGSKEKSSNTQKTIPMVHRTHTSSQALTFRSSCHHRGARKSKQ